MSTTSTSANTTITPGQELRLAATRLRCGHAFPIQPPHGSLAKPGDCRQCGVTYPASSPVADRLREPLAASLDKAAMEYECFGSRSEWTDCPTAASLLLVAHAINGGATAGAR